jgi:hypothetical protein
MRKASLQETLLASNDLLKSQVEQLRAEVARFKDATVMCDVTGVYYVNTLQMLLDHPTFLDDTHREAAKALSEDGKTAFLTWFKKQVK